MIAESCFLIYTIFWTLPIRKMAAGKNIAPNSVLEHPAYGKTTYNMRPDDLKMKPKAKTSKK